MAERSKRARPLICTAALASLVLLLFTPFDIYRYNLDEFTASFPAILALLLVLAITLFLALLALGWLLPQTLYERFLAVLLTLGALTWIQGNFLTWEYGRLEGVGIDWNQGAWRGWVDGGLWAALIIVAMAFPKKVSRMAAPASVILIAVQLVVLLAASIQNPESWKRIDTDLRPPEPVFELSSATNVIHIIFDAFPSYSFEEIVNERIEYYREAFRGFIFFREAIGAFPTTLVSVPAFMNGAVYRNDVPMRDFLDSVMGGKTVTNVAHDNGYEVDFVDRTLSFYGRQGARYDHFYRIPVPYESSQRSLELRNAALMLDLALFRSAPHFIKRSIYNNQLWLFQRWFSREPYERFVVFAHRAFLKDFIESMSVRREKPVYKLMHFFHTHGPLVVGADGEFVGEPLPFTMENALPQYKAAVAQLVELLDGLRAQGVYDSSLIVFHSDHGQRIFKLPGMATASNDFLGNVVSAALPVVLIKPPYSSEPMSISNAPVALTDLPATISSLLGFEESFDGVSMLEVAPGADRIRTFHDYEWISKYNNSEYMDWIEEYRVAGSAFDRTSWQSISIHRPGAAASDGAERGAEPAPERTTYSLDGAAQTLTAADGMVFEVDAAALAGQVEIVTADAGRTVIAGWVVDLEQGVAPLSIAVFEDREPVHAGQADRKCPNADCRARVNQSRRAHGNPEVGWAGFRFDLPSSLFEDDGAAAIRVFGISPRGVATELEGAPPPSGSP